MRFEKLARWFEFEASRPTRRSRSRRSVRGQWLIPRRACAIPSARTSSSRTTPRLTRYSPRRARLRRRRARDRPLDHFRRRRACRCGPTVVGHWPAVIRLDFPCPRAGGRARAVAARTGERAALRPPRRDRRPVVARGDARGARAHPGRSARLGLRGRRLCTPRCRSATGDAEIARRATLWRSVGATETPSTPSSDHRSRHRHPGPDRPC